MGVFYRQLEAVIDSCNFLLQNTTELSAVYTQLCARARARTRVQGYSLKSGLLLHWRGSDSSSCRTSTGSLAINGLDLPCSASSARRLDTRQLLTGNLIEAGGGVCHKEKPNTVGLRRHPCLTPTWTMPLAPASPQTYMLPVHCSMTVGLQAFCHELPCAVGPPRREDAYCHSIRSHRAF